MASMENVESVENVLLLNNSYFEDSLGLNNAKLFKKKTIIMDNSEIIVMELDKTKLLYHSFPLECQYVDDKYFNDILQKYKNEPPEFYSVAVAITKSFFMSSSRLLYTFPNLFLAAENLKFRLQKLNETLDLNYSSIQAYKVKNNCYFVDVNNTDIIEHLIKFIDVFYYNENSIFTKLDSIVVPAQIEKHYPKKDILISRFAKYMFKYIYNKEEDISNINEFPDIVTIKRILSNAPKNIYNINNSRDVETELDVDYKQLIKKLVESYMTKNLDAKKQYFESKKKYIKDESESMQNPNIFKQMLKNSDIRNRKINSIIKLINDKIHTIIYYNNLTPVQVGERKVYILYSDVGYIINLKRGGQVICHKQPDGSYNVYFELRLENINELKNTSTGDVNEPHNDGCNMCRLAKTRCWIDEKKGNKLAMNLGDATNFTYYDSIDGRTIQPIGFIFQNVIGKNNVFSLKDNKISDSEERLLSIPYAHIATQYQNPNCTKENYLKNFEEIPKRFRDHLFKDKNPACGAYVYKGCLDDNILYYFKASYDTAKAYAYKKYGKQFDDYELDYGKDSNGKNINGRYYKYKKPSETSVSDKGQLTAMFHIAFNSVPHVHLHIYLDSKARNFYDACESGRFFDLRGDSAHFFTENVYTSAKDSYCSYKDDPRDKTSATKTGELVEEYKPLNELEHLTKIKDLDSIMSTECSFEYMIKLILNIINNNDYDKNVDSDNILEQIAGHHWIFEDPTEEIINAQPDIIESSNQYAETIKNLYNEQYNEFIDINKKYLEKKLTETATMDNATATMDNATATMDNVTPTMDNATATMDNVTEVSTKYYLPKDDTEDLNLNLQIINRNYFFDDVLAQLLKIYLELDEDIIKNISGFFDCTNPNFKKNTLNDPKLYFFKQIDKEKLYITLLEKVDNAPCTSCSNFDNKLKKKQLFVYFVLHCSRYNLKKNIVTDDVIYNNDLIENFISSDKNVTHTNHENPDNTTMRIINNIVEMNTPNSKPVNTPENPISFIVGAKPSMPTTQSNPTTKTGGTRHKKRTSTIRASTIRPSRLIRPPKARSIKHSKTQKSTIAKAGKAGINTRKLFFKKTLQQTTNNTTNTKNTLPTQPSVNIIERDTAKLLLTEFPTVFNGKELNNEYALQLSTEIIKNFNKMMKICEIKDIIETNDENIKICNDIIKYIMNKIPPSMNDLGDNHNRNTQHMNAQNMNTQHMNAQHMNTQHMNAQHMNT